MVLALEVLAQPEPDTSLPNEAIGGIAAATIVIFVIFGLVLRRYHKRIREHKKIHTIMSKEMRMKSNEKNLIMLKNKELEKSLAEANKIIDKVAREGGSLLEPWQLN